MTTLTRGRLPNPVPLIRLSADDSALSVSDAVTVTVLPAGGSDPDLVGYWSFDATPEDRSGNGNHAQLEGQAEFVTDRAPAGSGNVGALSPQGGGFAMLPHASSLAAPQSVTVALWVKFRALPPVWPTQYHSLSFGFCATWFALYFDFILICLSFVYG